MLRPKVLIGFWCHQCVMHRPSVAQTMPESRFRNAKVVGPFGETLRSTEVVDQVISPRVSGLFRSCYPSTVGGIVGTVIVDPVDGMLGGGSRPHVGQKVGELTPPLAHDNAAAPVVVEPGGSRVIAARVHGQPDPVFRRGGAVDSEAVREPALPYALDTQAPARPRVPGSEFRLFDPRRIAAITAAFPELARATPVGHRQDRAGDAQFFVSVPGQVEAAHV